jgi:hypothetical protein
VGEGGSVGCGKIPQDDFLANRCKKGGLDLLEEATSNWARSSNNITRPRPLFKNYRTRLNYSATPGPNIMATKYENPHRITPQSFPRRCFSNHTALFAMFFLCAVHTSVHLVIPTGSFKL